MHLGQMLSLFKGCRLARMSSGRYCLVRDLGLVKGGKGMRHHEVVMAFGLRDLTKWLRQPLAGRVQSTRFEARTAANVICGVKSIGAALSPGRSAENSAR